MKFISTNNEVKRCETCYAELNEGKCSNCVSETSLEKVCNSLSSVKTSTGTFFSEKGQSLLSAGSNSVRYLSGKGSNGMRYLANNFEMFMLGGVVLGFVTVISCLIYTAPQRFESSKQNVIARFADFDSDGKISSEEKEQFNQAFHTYLIQEKRLVYVEEKKTYVNSAGFEYGPISLMNVLNGYERHLKQQNRK